MTNFKDITFMTKDQFSSLSVTPVDQMYAVAEGLVPDYTAGVSVAANTTYTCPSRGCVVFVNSHAEYSSTNAVINGVTIYSGTAVGNYGSGNAAPTSYLVGKGYTASSANAFMFYPMR